MAISGEQFEKECRVKHYQDVAGQAQVDRRKSDRAEVSEFERGYFAAVDAIREHLSEGERIGEALAARYEAGLVK